MNTKLGMLKQAVLVACCAASVGAMPIAHADSFGIGYHSGWHGHSGYAVSIGAGPAYYGGYYAAPYYPYRRCYYDYYGYYHCGPNYASAYYYGGGPYYGPAVSLGYYRGWGHGAGWRGGGWHGGGHQWHR
jgi:hypothetical protein